MAAAISVAARGALRWSRLPAAFAMTAPGPAARAPHAVLELFLSPAYPPLSRRGLLRVLDPADELVASERCDVVPSLESDRVGEERGAQV